MHPVKFQCNVLGEESHFLIADCIFSTRWRYIPIWCLKVTHLMPSLLWSGGLFILTVTHSALSEQLLFASLSLWETKIKKTQLPWYVNHELKFKKLHKFPNLKILFSLGWCKSGTCSVEIWILNFDLFQGFNMWCDTPRMLGSGNEPQVLVRCSITRVNNPYSTVYRVAMGFLNIVYWACLR